MFRKLAKITILALASSVVALNILLTNDDSWASANIRATYDALKAAGHNVLLVGAAVNQSGKGGTFVLPTTNITAPGGEFGTIPPGAPFFGHAVDDPHIFYFNGSPAATAVWGLEMVVPKFFNAGKVDLVVSGPNEGGNAGPFLFTLSGTIGAAYVSVGRGVPAVALSAGNSTHRSFTTNTGKPDDPANIAARLTANFVAALAKGVDTSKHRLLPLGVGLDVNFPTFSSSCADPPFVFSRITGGNAFTDKIVINPQTGLPTFGDLVTPAVNVVHNGVPILRGETDVSSKCTTSVSVFSIDYDAPIKVAEPVQLQLLPIIGESKLP